jgi:hypothetical protein
MARRVLHTLMGSKFALRTRTGSYIVPSPKTSQIIAWVLVFREEAHCLKENLTIETIVGSKRMLP